MLIAASLVLAVIDGVFLIAMVALLVGAGLVAAIPLLGLGSADRARV